MFELDVNFQDQRVFLEAKGRFSSLNRRIKYGHEQRQVREIQSRIRDEMNKKAEFDIMKCLPRTSSILVTKSDEHRAS